jgi:hypothetical protein
MTKQVGQLLHTSVLSKVFAARCLSQAGSGEPVSLCYACCCPQVCQQHVLGGSSLLQKRSYRVLAYLAGARPDWLKAHLQLMLELMLLASAVALSPAKRYRLRCAKDRGLSYCCRNWTQAGVSLPLKLQEGHSLGWLSTVVTSPTCSRHQGNMQSASGEGSVLRLELRGG